MAKHINADTLKAEISRNMDMQDLYLPYEFINLIDEQPESIVRCKDCKFFEPVSEYSGNCYRNEINNIFDGYCNKAERRESE